MQDFLNRSQERKIRLQLYENLQRPTIIWDGGSGDISYDLIIKLFVLKNRENGYHCYYFEDLRQLCQKRRQCSVCHAVYDNHHSCPRQCHDCRAGNRDCQRDRRCEQLCRGCHRVFNTQLCFRNHLATDLCSKLKVCDQCGKTVETGKESEHSCGVAKCHNCAELVRLEDHECFITKLDLAKLGTPAVFKTVCFDAEAYQEENGEHVAYCYSALLSCQLCFDSEEYEVQCPNCKKRIRTFYSDGSPDDVTTRFTQWLFYSSETKNATAFSYNGGGYDNFFLIKKLLSMNRMPTVLANGGRVIELKMNGS